MRRALVTLVACLAGSACAVLASSCSDERSSGGCEEDTDCKGDRVCEDGDCVEPGSVSGDDGPFAGSSGSSSEGSTSGIGDDGGASTTSGTTSGGDGGKGQ